MDSQLSFASLMSGVKAIRNEDGFPLESMPPQGGVIVTFGDGTEITLNANEEEYLTALSQLRGESKDQQPC